MKALTIKQPWATLIALGEKQYETRSWQTKYRGKIAIHAGKTIDKEACQYPEIKQALNKHGIVLLSQLPTGAVIAVADLTNCFQVVKDHDDFAETTGDIISEHEYPFGDYTEGRFAWKLEKVTVLEQPFSAKGQLSLWEWQETPH